MKIAERQNVKKIKKSVFNELFTTSEKEGFSKLTDDELRILPRGLQDSVKYVNNNFKRALMGKRSVSLSNDKSHQYVKVADRLLRDATTRLKKNNVVLNTASHVNAIMYNQSVGASLGIDPRDMLKWQHESVAQSKEITEIFSRIADKRSRGNSISAELRQLEKNELYQMESKGLSTNTIEGISQAPDLWRQIFSDTTKKIENKFDIEFGRTRTVMNNLFGESDSAVGKMFNDSFTIIDTQGRYMVTKFFMSKRGGNMPIEKATKEANGLFADMDQIAPDWVDMLDKYPAMPFFKWFSSVIPGTTKYFMKNPTKFILTSMALYKLSQLTEDEDSRKSTGIRTVGGNIIESNLAFLEDSTFGTITDITNDINRNTSTSEKVFRAASKYALASFITKPIKKLAFENKDIIDTAQSFVVSNRPQNRKDLKGSPLENESWIQEFVDSSAIK